MIDGFQEILFSLRHNKLRTGLTAFGVFWGIFMLILLLGAGRGLQNGVMSSFGDAALDTIVLFSGTTAEPFAGLDSGREIQFRPADVQAIRSQLSTVEFASAENALGSASITYDGRFGSFSVFGIDDRYFDVKYRLPFGVGRKTNVLDQQQRRKVAIIGTAVVDRLFGAGQDPVGEYVEINGVVIRVVGVHHDTGGNGRAPERVYIPRSTFVATFGGAKKVTTIWVKPEQHANPFEVEKQVIRLLQRRHQVSPEDRRAITAFNMAEPAKMITGMFAGINALVWFVGIGTLAAGIVGVGNIMIITVKERTREIGIRKALGARPRSIVATLLLESILITGVAGYGGLVLGVGLLELVRHALETTGADLPFFQRPEIDFATAVASVVLLVTAGVLAGLVPAVQAARIMPVEAMRHE